MKSKSFIVALLTVFALGLTTSCADMFDIDSTRVVYEKDHNLDATSDSAYTTLGVLQCMREIADRYVILGEVRGDLVEVNENTKTSLRNLANFNFDADNEYLDVKDYYAIINNCNYALAKMDTTLAINNQRVMVDEYAALLGVRAWTYLQLAINYGEVPYYTEPVTTMGELDAVGGNKKNVKEIAEDQIPMLLPYLDYTLPSFVSTIPQNVYPILRLVVAELYLWSGDYSNAVKYYEEYLMKNKKFVATIGSGDDVVYFNGFVSLGGSFSTWDGETKKPGRTPFKEDYTTLSTAAGGYENLAYIPMESSTANGLVSELKTLFYSFDNTHYLYPSTYWKELSGKQTVFHAKEESTTGKVTFKSSSLVGGDMRKDLYYDMESLDGEEFDRYTKHRTSSNIVFSRRAITYLRYAEAMNALAHDLDKAWRESGGADTLSFESSRMYANHAFYILKDAYQVFFPVGSKLREDNKRFEKDLQKLFIGVHGRGTGHVYLDKEAYVLTPAAIATRFEMPDSAVAFNDTIKFIDELIIDELALESTLEGNRFGDLVRFAKRRQVWNESDGDSESYLDFLAKRVASRGGAETFDTSDSLYVKLSSSEDYWYLPLK